MLDNPNDVTIDDTVLSEWMERDRAHVALWMKDEDGGQSQELVAEWWDEDYVSLVEDGFLNPRDLHGSAFSYAASLGLLNPANRAKGEPAHTVWVVVHESKGALLGYDRESGIVWSVGADREMADRGAMVFSDEEHAVGYVREDMPDDEADELCMDLAAYELVLDVPPTGQVWPSRVSLSMIEAAGIDLPKSPSPIL